MPPSDGKSETTAALQAAWDAAIRESVLNAWARGSNMYEIGAQLGIAPKRALRIVHTARAQGDNRAFEHGGGPKAGKGRYAINA